MIDSIVSFFTKKKPDYIIELERISKKIEGSEYWYEQRYNLYCFRLKRISETYYASNHNPIGLIESLKEEFLLDEIRQQKFNKIK